jgi:cytochrome c biogenesis protein CcmG/thiol:disulfide interchange protein DsbE
MPSEPRSRTPLVLGLLALVIVVIAVVAVVVSGGGGDDENDATDDAPDVTSVAGTGEAVGPSAVTGEPIDPLTATLTVTGDPLAPFEGDPDADVAVGTPAPGLAGTDYDGNPTAITPGEDGPTLVVFLAHWCPHCNAEIPVLNEWRDAGGVPDDLRIVAVSTGVSTERPNYPPGEWLEEKGWEWDVIADGPFDGSAPPAGLVAYGVSAYPFFTLIDAAGNVAARGSGELPVEALEELVARVSG